MHFGVGAWPGCVGRALSCGDVAASEILASYHELRARAIDVHSDLPDFARDSWDMELAMTIMLEVVICMKYSDMIYISDGVLRSSMSVRAIYEVKG
jgi:hypothetical protein